MDEMNEITKQQASPADPKNPNIASSISKEEREKIGRAVCSWYRDDKKGRKSWEDKRNRWYKLGLMEREKKTDPWPDASNVCLPLLAVACNQFHSRAYQAFFAPPQFVKCLPVEENDFKRSKDVESFMNWQVMYDMPDYEEETDKLLLNTPISGTNFKKVYYDREHERPCSDYVSGLNVVLPYRTTSLSTARRVCHETWSHYDDLALKNTLRDGYFIDFDKVTESAGADEHRPSIEETKDKAESEAAYSDQKPKLILECHGWWKMPGKDKPEPYIFTVDFDSETLIRATSRIAHGTEKVMCYFVDYHFIPNPEGFYSFGFGHFLETLNEMANTAFNQIFDAGRISNQPFGFYGRRAGIKKKEIKLHPGRMEEVEDASQVYFPNMQRVDQVLFQVLGLIQQYSESFTSTSDYLMGREARGVKTPTKGGTEAIIEQGLIIFGVLTKRLFRSLKKELGLMYAMNQLYLPQEKQFRVVGAEDKIAFPTIKRSDFMGNMDVIPLGDPTYASRLTRRAEAMEIYQLFLTNPLTGVADPRVQVQNPKALLAAMKEVVDTYNRPNLAGALPELPPEPKSPFAENAMFMQGDSHDPMAGEDHALHFKTHLGFLQSEYFKSMPDDYKKLLIDHLDKTKAMMYAEGQAKAALGGAPPMEFSSQVTFPQAPISTSDVVIPVGMNGEINAG
jgi:chaperonin GroES